MRRISVPIGLVAAAVAATLLLAGTGMSATLGVSITKAGFQPQAITVAAGDTVTWTNGDTVNHQVVADDGSFSSPVLAPKQSYSHTFATAGSVGYHDGLHPTLKGTITVAAPGKVSITSSGFEPATTTIKAGETVTWTNTSTANQQVVADDGSFTSPVLAPKESFTHTFATAGTFGYHDGLQPTLKGSVDVTAVPPPKPAESVSLQSSTDFVTYGNALTLSGQVTNGTAGESVSLSENPQLPGLLTRLTTMQTATDGSFSATVHPLVHTVYVAATAKARSNPLAISVRPRLSLGWVAHRTVRLRVSAARAFTHKSALIQYWNARAHVWSSIARMTLTSSTALVSPTIVTTGTLHLRVRSHLRLRALLPFSQARPAYASGTSNTIRS